MYKKLAPRRFHATSAFFFLGYHPTYRIHDPRMNLASSPPHGALSLEVRDSETVALCAENNYDAI